MRRTDIGRVVQRPDGNIYIQPSKEGQRVYKRDKGRPPKHGYNFLEEGYGYFDHKAKYRTITSAICKLSRKNGSRYTTSREYRRWDSGKLEWVPARKEDHLSKLGTWVVRLPKEDCNG